MKKIIRKHGLSLGINFNSEECIVNDLRHGDVIEIQIISKQRSKKIMDKLLGK